MEKNRYIGIAGAVLCGATYLVDRLICKLPDVLYFILLGVSVLLLIIGMAVTNRRSREE